MPHLKRQRSSASPSFEHEMVLQASGCQVVAGIDEAGRGAWAGPVVAAAVILRLDAATQRLLQGVNDSKQLTAHQREEYRIVIEHTALAYTVALATQEEIDTQGIVPATRWAMIRATQGLSLQPDALVIDAVKLPDLPMRQDVFYYADSISLSVAAASILAKTARDTLMRQLDQQVPGYGFARHKGYGTTQHQQALRELGVSAVHRRSYAPIRKLLLAKQEAT
jgi:ribonuclease HII